jgi:plastocyanin
MARATRYDGLDSTTVYEYRLDTHHFAVMFPGLTVEGFSRQHVHDVINKRMVDEGRARATVTKQVSASALFLLASGFPDGAPPASGKVEVGPNQSEDVFLVPRAPGTYKFECTHFLHSLFNMTGSIVVE